MDLKLEKSIGLYVECVFGELLQGVKSKSEQEIIYSFWRHLPKENYENIILEAGELYASPLSAGRGSVG